MTATESKEIETPAWSQAPGASLRAAREARQLQIDKVAVELHLSRAMVEAIERDDYEVLPGSVFVRGYLKNYARLVGLSVSHILQGYESRRPEETLNTPVVKKSIRSEVSSGHTGVRLVTWAIVLILLALVVVWWRGYVDWTKLGSSIPPNPVIVPGAELQLEGHSAPEAVMPSGESVVPAQTLESFTPPPEEPAPPSSAAPEASPPPSAAPAPQASATRRPAVDRTQSKQVVLAFSSNCWVDLRDSSGRFKYSGEARKGEKRTLEGVPPWSLVLGNSRAVDITVGGRPFDYSRYVTGNVARFTLDPDKL